MQTPRSEERTQRMPNSPEWATDNVEFTKAGCGIALDIPSTVGERYKSVRSAPTVE